MRESMEHVGLYDNAIIVTLEEFLWFLFLFTFINEIAAGWGKGEGSKN